MIDRLEILEFAREFGLTPEIVEKDYALGWLLGGISNHPALRSTWLFKGGTCLKKCYFSESTQRQIRLFLPGPHGFSGRDKVLNSPYSPGSDSPTVSVLSSTRFNLRPICEFIDEQGKK